MWAAPTSDYKTKIKMKSKRWKRETRIARIEADEYVWIRILGKLPSMKFVLFKNFINELFHSRFAADFTRNYNFNFLCELPAAVTKACNFATFINRQRHRDRVAIMRKRERWFRNGFRWCVCVCVRKASKWCVWPRPVCYLGSRDLDWRQCRMVIEWMNRMIVFFSSGLCSLTVSLPFYKNRYLFWWYSFTVS